MPNKNVENNIDFLFDLFMHVETKEELETLFNSICTPNELASLSQRAVVARMLTQNKVYRDIVESTGASTATISRVNRSLRFDKNGYDVIFARLDKADKE